MTVDDAVMIVFKIYYIYKFKCHVQTQVCNDNSLVTRSSVNLSEEEKKSNSSGKRIFPGKQFIQKLSTINLGTLKKVKPKRKIRRDSVKVMGRMPAPLPSQEPNIETSNWDRQSGSVSYQDESKTSSNLDLASTQNFDSIYGNLPVCSGFDISHALLNISVTV